MVHDSLAWYGRDARGGRVHDLLGTRCDPYVGALLAAGHAYDFHCHSNLVRAVRPWGLDERDVHDVLNLFQVTGLDDRGRYCMSPCPAVAGDCVEFLAEQDLLMALSASAPPPLFFFFFHAPFFAPSASTLCFRSRVHRLTAADGTGTCPGGDLSAWGFGADSERDMAQCCRPLRVEVFELRDTALLAELGWRPAAVSPYRGQHGVVSPLGEGDAPKPAS